VIDDDHGLAVDRQATYQIEVRGRIDAQWSDWLSGMSIAYADGVSTLTGSVVDQSALLGILTKLGQMNLTLISVNRLEAGPDGMVLPRGSWPTR
jgi:hypothetical protein